MWASCIGSVRIIIDRPDRRRGDVYGSSEIKTREQRRYYDTVTPMRDLVMFLVRTLGRTIYKLETGGQEWFPEEGGCILAANHVNVLDVFPLEQVSPRPIFFMAKAELHRSPILDAVLRQLGSFPVNRGHSDKWALQRASYLINHGRVLGMFPEGTRSRGNGLRPAKPGAAHLALEHRCPIIPVGISGIDGDVRLGRSRMTIRILFGAPLVPRKDEDPTELTDRLMFTIASLLPPGQRGAYRVAPPGFNELGKILKTSSIREN
jgi:1-acyl-sn-glycerol-3-phosphate acyltransferase